MSDNETQYASQTSGEKIELESSDRYARYLLYSRAEILAILRTLAQKGTLMTIHFDGGQQHFLSLVVGVSSDEKRLILDVGVDAEMNQKVQAAKKLSCVTLLDRVKIQFSVEGATLAQHEGRAAFFAPMPSALLRLQRREFFRLQMSLTQPVMMSTVIRNADGSASIVELPLFDISAGGVGLTVPLELEGLFERGNALTECKFVLDDAGKLVSNLIIRNKTELVAPNGSVSFRVGCEYQDLSSSQRTMVQRYIIHVERERKAKMSGLM